MQLSTESNEIERAASAPFGRIEIYHTAHLRAALGAVIILALVLFAYSPLLPGMFILDDQHLLTDGNSLVTGEFNPSNIWFQTDFTLSTFVFWLQTHAWGLTPGPYHAVNMLLHATSALLLWRLLARLKIPGAWLAAAIFALHPVCVNSVGRIAELKNTLSLPFFLASILFYLHYESLSDLRPVRRALWNAFSLVAFVLALLSKTSTVMLPAVLLACAVWQRGRPSRSDFVHTGPFLFLAAAFGLMSIWFQKHIAMALAGQSLEPISFWEHLTVAGRVFWFYLAKALAPLNLNVVYPRWHMDPGAFLTYLPIFLFAMALAVCWRFRRSWGRPVLLGLGIFAITLFPVLGFFDSQFLTAWQVSDHLQYLPLIAPVALAAGVLATWFSPKAFRYVASALLLTLTVLCYQRAQVFASPETLFRDTIAKNPDAWKAQNDLGVIFAARTNYVQAVHHFASSLQSNPNNHEAHSNLGRTLALQGKFQEAEPHFKAALQLAPMDSETHKIFAAALDQQGRLPEALHHLQMASRLKPDLRTHLDLAAMLSQTGDPSQAVTQYRQALLLNADCVEALNNLAWLLATTGDEKLRNGAEAVRHAERASHLPAPKDLCVMGTLAAAYAEAGRFPEAIVTAETAVEQEVTTGQHDFADINRQLLRFYRVGKPWHERRTAEQRHYGAS